MKGNAVVNQLATELDHYGRHTKYRAGIVLVASNCARKCKENYRFNISNF